MYNIDKRLSTFENLIKPAQKEVLPFSQKLFPIPDNVGEVLKTVDYRKLKVDDKLFHQQFGYGTIIELSNINSLQATATINFGDNIKRLMLRHAKLRKVK